MKSVRWTSAIGFGLLSAVLFAGDSSSSDETCKLLARFLEDHTKLLEAQDAEAAIANLHSRGKNREKSIRDLRTKLAQMPFTYKVRDVRYIGTDGEFHYVRYTQHTLFNEKWKTMSGAQGIEMDVVTILAQEQGAWKIFDSYMFSQKKLGETGQQSPPPDK